MLYSIFTTFWPRRLELIQFVKKLGSNHQLEGGGAGRWYLWLTWSADAVISETTCWDNDLPGASPSPALGKWSLSLSYFAAVNSDAIFDLGFLSPRAWISHVIPTVFSHVLLWIKCFNDQDHRKIPECQWERWWHLRVVWCGDQSSQPELVWKNMDGLHPRKLWHTWNHWGCKMS